MPERYLRKPVPHRKAGSYSILHRGATRVFLNETGSAIWNMVDGTSTNEDITARLVGRYTSTEDLAGRIATTVNGFLNTLFVQGLLYKLNDGEWKDADPSLRLAQPTPPTTNSAESGKESDVHSLQEGCMTPKLQKRENTLEERIHSLYWDNCFIEKMHVELTYRCNFRCVHCYNTTHVGGKDELNTGEWLRVLGELAELGCYDATFTGGEIFVRKDVLEILRTACELGFSFRINTNGSLIDEKLLGHFESMRPWLQSFDISFYGATPDVHDTLARRMGAHEKTVRAVRLLAQAKFPLVAKFVTMRDNFDGIDQFEKDMEELGVPHCVHTGSLIPQTDRNQAPLVQLLTDKQYEKLLDTRRHSAGAGNPGACRPGIIRGAITPEGFVSPCEWLTDFKLGNLREHTLTEIWHGEKFRNFRTVIEEDAECATCNLQSGCSRCPAHSYLETGNLLKCAPIQRHNAELTLAHSH
jgi:MoaA/NifB/PqqE/SkfB family radical SAM enzyme